MDRRHFIAGVGASIAAASMLGYTVLSGPRQTWFVGSIGTWAEGIAKAISARSPVVRHATAADLIGLNSSERVLPPRVVLAGALGGLTGLRVATDYASASRSAPLQLEAVVLLPGYWEGLRRIDVAEETLNVLEDARVPVTIVHAETTPNQTLQEWGQVRKRALERGLFNALALPHGFNSWEVDA